MEDNSANNPIAGATAVVLIWYSIIYTGLALFAVSDANCFYTEKGVRREILAKYPSITRIIATHRNVQWFSKIEVEEGGWKRTYLLDADIFFNYRFIPPGRYDHNDVHPSEE